MERWKRVSRALSIVLVGVTLVTAARAQIERDDDRDVVQLTDGKEMRGRVKELYATKRGDSIIRMLEKGKEREIDRTEVQSTETVRDRLRDWLGQRGKELGTASHWKLVAEAEELGLPKMARLQAYYVILLDPGHAEAHAFLEHRRRGDDWQWRWDGKYYDVGKLGDRISEWGSHLVLESEHYTVETDAGFRLAVDVLFDLESVYVYFMDTFGVSLQAAEDVDEKNERMTWHVYADRDDYKEAPSQLKEPYYDPSTQFRARSGSDNVASTYLLPAYATDRTVRPRDLVSLAVQQLLYSLLLYGKEHGSPSTSSITRHAHWFELGLGYYVQQSLHGPMGFPYRGEFVLEDRVVEAVNAKGSGALATRTKEVTNLVGLQAQDFYGTSASAPLNRDKARALFAYMYLQPHEKQATKKDPLDRTRAGLMCYAMAVYNRPTAHSTKEMDKCLDARIDRISKYWRAWGEASQ